ncbi:hypothetical protein BD414DRAFT_468727 [Trametes punicea]|nr:hypothetical protein BD414DRAFT_468727 [Trametes punicea]
MHRSLTTTIPMQRDVATAMRIESTKELTLRLEPHLQQSFPPPNRMANAAYQAPIERLPVELLSYIFVLGAHTPDPAELEADSPEGSAMGQGSELGGEEDISPCLSSSSTPPDVFAAVNRHWREVALATPQLWTRICVTIGDIVEDGAEGGWFPTVTRYVSRSRMCPLDVHIDARDPDWDFSEDDSVGAVVSPNIDETYDYTHPFQVEHMHYVLNILLPHIARMRSLAILTDRWAPMQTALECLSFQNPTFIRAPDPLPSSLPLLESLVFMRCNEFVSYHPQFSPLGQHNPAHLPFRGLLPPSERPHGAKPLLPRLRQLILSGVHLDWSSLPVLLPRSQPLDSSGLRRLELSYHCTEVRPTKQELRDILQSCERLQTLTVRVSGPQAPDSPVSCSPVDGMLPVTLPSLKALELGYYEVCTATTFLSMVDCSEVERVALEDSYPEHDDARDADRLLLACTKVASLASPNFGKPVFPRASSVVLRRVEASAEAFETFYEALPSLRELTVAQMFLLGGKALASRDIHLTFIPPDIPTSTPTGFAAVQNHINNDRVAEGEWSPELFSGRAFAVEPGPRALEGRHHMLW